MDSLDAILEGVREALETTNTAREHALALSREIIRLSANAVRAIHREDFDRARQLQTEARSRIVRLREQLQAQPSIYWTGYVQDSLKEYAESCLTLALILGEVPPGPAELQVENAAYLNGLGEAVGELRRHFLDLLRGGRVHRAEEVLNLMDDAYNGLVTFDYPEALTGGLRRTCDMVRGVLERSWGDLTAAIRQEQLQDALKRVEDISNGG